MADVSVMLFCMMKLDVMQVCLHCFQIKGSVSFKIFYKQNLWLNVMLGTTHNHIFFDYGNNKCPNDLQLELFVMVFALFFDVYNIFLIKYVWNFFVDVTFSRHHFMAMPI